MNKYFSYNINKIYKMHGFKSDDFLNQNQSYTFAYTTTIIFQMKT